jgi:hypothetical protein
MNNRFLVVIIIAIIAIIALGAAFTLGLGNNNQTSDNSNWEVKELSGIKFKVPQKYEQGSTLTRNIIDGVNTGNSYQSEDLLITINSTNWTSELNNYMNSDSATMTLLEIEGKEIKAFNLDGKSIAFFELNNNNITVTWSGDNVNGDIKAIIASFFQQNK